MHDWHHCNKCTRLFANARAANTLVPPLTGGERESILLAIVRHIAGSGWRSASFINAQDWEETGGCDLRARIGSCHQGEKSDGAGRK